jgi:ElaB/YqjD/DUF883 family membrane-anchored ribosome-binding protein
MVVPINQLDEYERQLEALISEVREYESTGKILRGVTDNLAKIQKTNSDVGRSINLTAANIARSLYILEDLKLDEIEARTASNFQTQQRMLESLATRVQEVTQEQQRLNELLHHQSTVTNDQIESSAAHISMSLASMSERTATIEKSLAGLSVAIETRTNDLESNLGKLLWLGIGFTLLVGILVLMLFVK